MWKRIITLGFCPCHAMMATISACCYFLWCLVLSAMWNNATTLGAQTRAKRNHFYEILRPANTWPSGIREPEESRKATALVLCMNNALDAQQRKMCLKFPLQVAAVFQAYREAVDECQYQFRNERWNCSSLVSMRSKTIQPLGTKLMTRGMRLSGFKEVAFVHALVAAAVAKFVSLGCARGVMSSCDRMGSKRRQTKKTYINYDEAIKHGIYFSEKFLNSGKSSHDVQGMVSRHNLRAGRMVFTDTLKTLCKCHGMSGSCGIKTCIKTASGLRTIGSNIKSLFLNARKVEAENERRTRLKLIVVESRKFPMKSELVYTDNSPMFCERDGTLGTPGVSGRICSKNGTQANSCRNLCCGHGYNELWVKEDRDCECTFKWCCSVHCNKCTRRKWVTLCK